MTLDVQTFLLSFGLVVDVAGVTFIVHTVLRRSDAVGRTWSVAFVAGMLAALAQVMAGIAAELWWAWAVGNGAYVLCVALLWSGCRQFNERNPLLWISLCASIVVGVSTALRGPDGGLSAGSAELFVAIICFGTLAGIESVRRTLARSATARLVALLFWGVAAFYAARLLDLVIRGGADDSFGGTGGQLAAIAVATTLVVVSSISMSVLMMERQLGGRVDSALVSLRAIPGVLERERFEQHADDWLARARGAREALVLVILDIANLDHMNTAFGRDYGDQAIYAVGRIAAQNSPSAAIISHLRGSRFAILTTIPAVGNVAVVAENLHTALVETPVDPVEGIRAIATCGLATTDVSGYDRVALQQAALRALDTARASGPGSIRVEDTATQLPAAPA